MKKILQNIVLVAVLSVVVFLIAYSHKTACPGVAIYYKCKNFLDD